MPRPTPNLYAILRFWHRWSGVLTAPFLLIVSLTGALLVFHDFLDHWFQSGPEPVLIPGEPVSIQVAIDQVNATHEGWVSRVTIPADPKVAWTMLVSPEGSRWGNLRTVYYDPYRARITETYLQKDSFEALVTGLHRRLLAGKTGRILVELTTCWTIISVILGIALWWPKDPSRIQGNWLPRTNGSLKTQLRDWHAITGAGFAFFALIFMVTGLFFSSFWGKHFGRPLMAGNAFFYQNLPQSAVPEDADSPERISADAALSTAETDFRFRDYDFFIMIPGFKRESYSISTGWNNPFKPSARVIVDAWSGASLLFTRPSDLPLKTRIAMLVGPTHVGEVLGWPGRLIALLTCLILSGLALTGIWLWIKAPGLLPVNESPFSRYPRALQITIIILGLAFPFAGISMLLAWLGLRLPFLFRRFRRPA